MRDAKDSLLDQGSKGFGNYGVLLLCRWPLGEKAPLRGGGVRFTLGRMGQHRALSVAGEEDSRRWDDAKEIIEGWARIIAVAGGYYLLCLFANDWNWLYAALALVVAVIGIGVLAAIAIGVAHLMGTIGDLEGDSWWHGIAAWASDGWDSWSDGDGDDDGWDD
jgi:hypothetical protein